MKQAIAGVSPPELGEATTMIVWPSLAAFALGRLLGRLYGLKFGWSAFRLGRLFLLLAVPIALVLYFVRLLPGIFQRYRLTNRRVVVEGGFGGAALRAVELDDFDAIGIEVWPGQAWYHAGNLIFSNGPVETFRLRGVSRPEAFRHVCLEAQRAYVGVASALRQQVTSD
jgi:hypothetical protein